jgi:hypothetical protein
MYKSIIFNVLFILFMAIFALAQENEADHSQMAPLPPLEDEFMSWMVGEWKGTSTSQMGKSNDYMKCEMRFGGQFMIMTYKSKMENGMKMAGMGAITHDKEGKLAGYWIDSWRTMSEGTGSREGWVSTMKWTTAEGTFIQTTEKVDDNTMKVTGLMKNADGSEIRSKEFGIGT